MIRRHRPDEEPDFDEHDMGEVEQQFAGSHCERCGIAGHRGEKCPTVHPGLLKRDERGIPTRRKGCP